MTLSMTLEKSFRQLKLGAAMAAALDSGLSGSTPESTGISAASKSASDQIEQVVELSDEYAFRAIVLWLAAESLPGGFSGALERALSALSEYPFSTSLPCDNFPQFKDSAFEILSRSGQPAVVEALGDFYEHVQKFPLHYDQTKQCFLDQKLESKSSRRAVGQFYTPPDVVDYCWQKTFAAASGKQTNLTVLDPSCGNGNFLIGFLRQQHRRSNAQSLADIALSSLYGMDIDGRAVSLCRIAIIVTLARLCPYSFEGTGGDITTNLQQFLRTLRKNIQVSDALLACPASGQNDSQKQFDCVVTNPPYVSFGARNQPKLSGSSSIYLRSMFPHSSEYKVRLHSIFQELALRFLKPSGIATLLVPDGFLTGSYYGRLRKLLLQESRIRSVSELPTDTIYGAVVGRWCVAIYEKGAEVNDYPVQVSSAISLPEQQYCLQKSVFVSPQLRFRILLNQSDEELCKLTDALPPLSTVLQGHTGIRALQGQSSICASSQISPNWRKGLRSGSAVTPYLVRWDKTWLHVDKALLYGGGFNADIISNPKILVRQTGDRITAAVDLSGLYHLNNLHSLRLLDSSVNLHLIVALLNSTLWLYLYRMKTREQGRAMAQIDIETLESMPFPARDRELETAISNLSRALSMNIEAGSLSEFFRIAAAIDQLVYDLYGLNEAFVSHIEGDCGRLKLNYGRLARKEESATLVQGIRLKRSASPENGMIKA